MLYCFENLISSIGEKTTEYHWREFVEHAKTLINSGVHNKYQEDIKTGQIIMLVKLKNE